MHAGKELEAHYVDKGRLSCDSDAPQVGSPRSESTKVVKVNRSKTKHRKTRPYCTFIYLRAFVGFDMISNCSMHSYGSHKIILRRF
jgi:hypothetical protein